LNLSVAALVCAALLFAACDQSAPGATFDTQAGHCVAIDAVAEEELEACERGVTEVTDTLESVAAAQDEAFSTSGRHLADVGELSSAGAVVPESVELRVDEVNRSGYCIEAAHEELAGAGVMFHVGQTGKVHGGGCSPVGTG
jgi:hypothetical protein